MITLLADGLISRSRLVVDAETFWCGDLTMLFTGWVFPVLSLVLFDEDDSVPHRKYVSHARYAS